MQYRKKTAVVEATQWLRSGDHPQVQDVPPMTPAELDIPKSPYCSICGNLTERHGLLSGEEIVCPGDYILTDPQGAVQRLPRGEFEAQYEHYVRPPRHEPVPVSDIDVRKASVRARVGR